MMTPQQYVALADLSHIGPDTRTRDACLYHLVHGYTRAEAARRAGVNPQVVSNACRKLELTQSRLPALLATVRTAMGDCDTRGETR